MSTSLAADPNCLKFDEQGVLRVGGTRVTFDTVILAYFDGASPEEIAIRYDSLELADVHATIAYYLRHREEMDRYLQQRQVERERVREEVTRRQGVQAVRERLTRRNAQGS
jgi:uncharacterized protein (DUF433 family)